MEFTFSVNNMSDSGDNVVINLQSILPSQTGGVSITASHSLILSVNKADAADFFPGNKYTVVLEEVVE